MSAAGLRRLARKAGHLYLYHAGRNLFTTVPMPTGDLPRGLMKTIIKQAGLTEDEFRALL